MLPEAVALLIKNSGFEYKIFRDVALIDLDLLAYEVPWAVLSLHPQLLRGLLAPLNYAGASLVAFIQDLLWELGVHLM